MFKKKLLALLLAVCMLLSLGVTAFAADTTIMPEARLAKILKVYSPELYAQFQVYQEAHDTFHAEAEATANINNANNTSVSVADIRAKVQAGEITVIEAVELLSEAKNATTTVVNIQSVVSGKKEEGAIINANLEAATILLEELLSAETPDTDAIIQVLEDMVGYHEDHLALDYKYQELYLELLEAA